MRTMKLGMKTGNDKMMRVLVPSEHFEVLERMARAKNTTVSEIVRQQIREIVSTEATAA